MNEPSPGLYVHVPFCKSKCNYCGFYSSTGLEAIDDWLGSLREEAALNSVEFETFGTLYIGGGTPSLLSERRFEKMVEYLRSVYRFLPGAEITIEVNPDDITPNKLKSYKETGVNRISLGVQSLNDRQLSFLGRRHRSADALRALDVIHESGFSNVGVDLIYGFEGQSASSWKKTLSSILEFMPEHISCYLMSIEPCTRFGGMVSDGLIKETGEDLQVELYIDTSEILSSAGYIHYEVSNFSLGDEFVSRHNSKYWRHVDYLGLGPSAHSFLKPRRWWNVRSVDDYCRMLGDGKKPLGGQEVLSDRQLENESILLGLRTREGVDIEQLRNRPEWERILESLERGSLAEVVGGRLIPTLKGYLFADSLPLLFMD